MTASEIFTKCSLIFRSVTGDMRNETKGTFVSTLGFTVLNIELFITML